MNSEILRLQKKIAGLHRWQGVNSQQSPPCWILMPEGWILNAEIQVIDKGLESEMHTPVACIDCRAVAMKELSNIDLESSSYFLVPEGFFDGKAGS